MWLIKGIQLGPQITVCPRCSGIKLQFYLDARGLEYESLIDIYLLNSEVPRIPDLLSSEKCPAQSYRLVFVPRFTQSSQFCLTEPDALRVADGRSGFLSTCISSFITQSLSTGIMKSSGCFSLLLLFLILFRLQCKQLSLVKLPCRVWGTAIELQVWISPPSRVSNPEGCWPVSRAFPIQTWLHGNRS